MVTIATFPAKTTLCPNSSKMKGCLGRHPSSRVVSACLRSPPWFSLGSRGTTTGMMHAGEDVRADEAQAQGAAPEKAQEEDDYTNLQRVKVYRLNENGHWDDKGTGHVSCEYMEVRVSTSHLRTILSTRSCCT